jgi:hypothetical protein
MARSFLAPAPLTTSLLLLQQLPTLMKCDAARPPSKPQAPSSLTSCQHKSVQNLIKEDKATGGIPIPKRTVHTDYDFRSGRSSPSSPPNVTLHHSVSLPHSARVSRANSPLLVASPSTNAEFRFEHKVSLDGCVCFRQI